MWGNHDDRESQALSKARNGGARTSAALDRLRASLPSWRARSALPAEATASVKELCSAAKAEGLTAEKMVVAVKSTCYSSEEVSELDTTSERDALLAKIVTACIKEYYRA